MRTNDTKIAALCQQVEQAVGQPMKTPKDFDLLSERIYGRLGDLLSRNTLRRIWGTMDDGVQPRTSTLDILARYVGYRSWDEFTTQAADPQNGVQSNFVMSRHIDVAAQLHRGDRLRLTWAPGRVCDVEYGGSLHFRVVASERTRLKPGDTFLCSLIIDSEPLFLDLVQQAAHPDQPPMPYVCGRIAGVHFEILKS